MSYLSLLLFKILHEYKPCILLAFIPMNLQTLAHLLEGLTLQFYELNYICYYKFKLQDSDFQSFELSVNINNQKGFCQPSKLVITVKLTKHYQKNNQNLYRLSLKDSAIE